MVMMVFQVAVHGGDAKPVLEGFTDAATVGDDQLVSEVDSSSANLNEPEAIVGTSDDVPAGTVESYSDGSLGTVASLGPATARARVSLESDKIVYTLPTGSYVVDRANPELISVLDIDGTIMVQESYFIVKSHSQSTIPANGRVIESSSSRLVVQYDLVSGKAPELSLATMELTTDFGNVYSPKMTAKILQVSPDLSNWNVAWIIVPGAGARVLHDEANDASSSLDLYVDSVLPASELLVKMKVPSSNGKGLSKDMVVSWKDAKEGSSTVTRLKTHSGANAAAIEINFETGRMEIDPTIITPSTSSSEPTAITSQRKTFFYAGYYWAFYNRGDLIVYQHSADGVTWSGETALPEGTPVLAGTGLDVVQRDGKVLITWVEDHATQDKVWAKIGTIYKNGIQWQLKVMPTGWYSPFPSAPAAAIGYDGAYYVAFQDHAYIQGGTWYCGIYRSTDGTTWRSTGDITWASSQYNWFALMPLANGRLAALWTWYTGNAASDCMVKVQYYSGGTWGGWSGWLAAAPDSAGGITTGMKGQAFSAIAEPDGTIHLAYVGADGCIRYSCFSGGYWTGAVVDSNLYVTPLSPSISLDVNGKLHIFHWSYYNYRWKVFHSEKSASETVTTWSTPEIVFYGSTGYTMKYVSCFADPVESNAVIWSEGSTNQVMFGTLPIPFGTSGAGKNAWDREGLSPYGTYFSSFGQAVSPGTGLLTIQQTDVSVPARGGMDLGISRIYMEPRYFEKEDGMPYMPNKFPYCDLGPGWSLDLPWMDSNYINLPGGQRFVIQWGNTGDPKVFENHDGVHFELRKFDTNPVFYQVTTSSGGLIRFSSNMKLWQICSDTKGYDPNIPLTPSTNYIQFNYHATTGDLQTITESNGVLARTITFTYNGGYAGAELVRITRPDGYMVNFTYQNYNNWPLLKTVTDEKGRVTTYNYDMPVYYDYRLTSVTFPSGSKIVYTYVADNTPGTDVRSYLVTSQATRKVSDNSLIRQTNFDYKVVGGKIRFANVTDLNEAGVAQGRTEYIFQSDLKYTSETQKSAAGVQMSRTETWYDAAGQPARVDTYKGSSGTVSYTTYTGYDDWGNVIYTRDAMGHEEYSSYANTKTENSFQGGNLLTRTTSGKIFYDAFDDWDFSDWSYYKSGGSSIALDATTDPPSAPALSLHRGDSSSVCVAYHAIPAQSGDFVVQMSWWTSSMERCYITGKSGASSRLNFSAYNTGFWYWSGSAWVPVGGTYSYRTWYELGFIVHYSTSTYDIYVDGVSVKTGAPLIGSGAVDSIRIQEGDSSNGQATTIIDDIRVYKSLSVTVNSMSGCVAELYDAKGKILDRSKTGVLSVTGMPKNFPPGYIKVFKIGDYSFQTPMMDIWGGDVYSLSQGMSSSNVAKTTQGFLRNIGILSDESPFPGTPIGITPHWTNDPDYAVNLQWYHELPFNPDDNYNGFETTSSLDYTDWTDALTQYVWLTKGKVPSEIMLQFKIDSSWYRAYWGGGANGEDLITTGTYTPTLKFRAGDVPQTTEQWLQLSVQMADFRFTSGGHNQYGVIYGQYGGTVRFDFTSVQYRGFNVGGLTSGYQVKLSLDSAPGWSISKGASANPNWLTAELTSAKTYSAPQSFMMSFAGASYDGTDTGSSEASKAYYTIPVSAISVKMYVESYSHNGGSWDTMDAGIRMRLYNIAGTNYATYTYWLACWYLGTDTKTPPDGNTIRVYGKPTLGSWLTVSRSPTTDWPSIDWASCSKVEVKLYDYVSGAAGDTFKVYFDDLSISASSTVSTLDGFDGNVDISLTAGSSVVTMMPWLAGVRAYPPTGHFEIWNAGSLLYRGPSTTEIYNWDAYTYSASKFYPNIIKSGIHNALVGTLTYQDYGKTVPQETYYKYDSDGYPVETKSNLGTGWVTSQSSYDAYGNLIQSVDGTGRVKYGEYSSADGYTYPTASGLRGYVGDPNSYERVTYVYETKTGKVKTSTDALTRVTSYGYDSLGRMIKTTYPDNAYTLFVINDAANTVDTKDYTSAGVLVQMTRSSFDTIGRLVKTERYGTGSTPYSSTSTVYNWQDKPLSSTDALGHTQSNTFDFLGRVTRTTYADNNYTVFVYDDLNNWITTDSYNVSSGALTHRNVKISDDLGRLNTTREYTSSTTYNSTLMTYDAVGNLLTVRAARAITPPQVIRMVYDSLDRLNMTTYPDYRYESAWYDSAGRVLGVKDREQNVTRTYYDAPGRVNSVVSLADTVSRVYDAAGQVYSKTSTLGSITYGYNKLGLINSITETIGSSSYSFTFGYDSMGNQLWVKYPDATNITYTYDAYNRARTVVKGSTTLLTLYYNKNDAVTSELDVDGWNTTYTYNSRDWIDSVVVKKGSTTRMSLAYKYDDVGNVVKITDSVAGKSESYRYDWLDRMVYARGPWASRDKDLVITFTYDAVGNRLTKVEGTTTTTYNYGRNNELTSDGTWTYVYDGNGNEAWAIKANAQMWNYLFNNLDQLTSVVKWTYASKKWTSATAGTYSYDANGARAKAVEGTTTTEYVYLGHNQLCEKTGTTYTDYIFVNGKARMKQVGTTVYFYYLDALSSTRQVWAQAGSSAAYSVKSYKPFGIPFGATGTEKLLYAGEMLVGAVAPAGLYYIGARWYDPSLGRFLSLDPELGQTSAPQTINRYVYCLNNPLRVTDPTGEGWLSKLSKWWDNAKSEAKKTWDKYKTTILTVVVIAVTIAAAIALPGVGAFIASVALGALQSGLNTWAHGGGLQDIAQSMIIGMAVGALSYGVGTGAGMAASKFGGALLKTEMGSVLKGVGGKIGSKIASKAPALWGRITTPTVKQSTGIGLGESWTVTGSWGAPVYTKSAVWIVQTQVTTTTPALLNRATGALIEEAGSQIFEGLVERSGVLPSFPS